MKKLLLIDSHALVHRFFHALPPLTTPAKEPINAVYGLSVVLMKIFREGKPDYAAAAIDRPEPTFRKEQFQAYKIHRPPAPNELISQFKRVPEVFEKFGIKVFSAAGYEADDIIGTLVKCYEKEPDLTTVILTGDLDALQLVEGEKIVAEIIKSGAENTIIYNEEAVKTRYGLKPSQLPDYKGLVGDASDNIPGVKGIGPKTAAALLQEFGNLEETFASVGIIERKTAEKLAGERETALLSRDLATIRRDAPIVCPTLSDLAVSDLPREELTAYFSELGFTSLVKRLAA